MPEAGSRFDYEQGISRGKDIFDDMSLVERLLNQSLWLTIRSIESAMVALDPMNNHPELCAKLVRVIAGDAGREEETTPEGQFLIDVVANKTADEAERIFAGIVEMKRERESGHRHRNSWAYLAYAAFMDATGREPSKAELRKCIEAQRDTFKDAPGADDGKGWTRVWEDCGLSNLPDKVGKKP